MMADHLTGVDSDEIGAHDSSLTLGRYVGVAPEDEEADFEETLCSIQIDLRGTDEEGGERAKRIDRYFEELGA